MPRYEHPSTESCSEDSQRVSFHARRVASVGVSHAIHDIYTAFLPSLLPVFIDQFVLSKTLAGLLAVFIQAPSLLQPLIGHRADRVNLRHAVIVAPAVSAVTMTLLGIASSYTALALLLVTAGISSAFMHAIGPVVAGRLSGEQLGRGMGFWMVGGELGRTLGPLVIVGALSFMGLAQTPWLMVPGILASLLLMILLKDVTASVPPRGTGLIRREALGKVKLLLPPVIGAVVVRSFLVSTLTTYLPTFLSEEGVSLLFAGASLSFVEAAGVVGVLLGGSLSDRLGRRVVLLASMLMTPPLMFAFLKVDGWLRVPLLLMLGFTVLALGPVILALVHETFAENRALVNGVYMALSFTVRSGATLALGVLGDRFSLRIAFGFSAVVPLLCLPLVLLLPRGSALAKKTGSDNTNNPR